MIDSTIGRLAAGEDLEAEEAETAFEAITAGHCRAAEIALFLTGLAMKGETVVEIAAAARVMRRHMTPIVTRRTGVLDTCGTGGDGSGTFNVSTAAALVAAAAGVPVAKHGNRRATSRSGSADVLAVLGVNVDADVSRVEQCLDELGICFCFAPLLHGGIRHVAAVRRELGIRTIYNYLGPLTNPAGAAYQLVGIGDTQRRPQIAQVLAELGTRRALVVSGIDGLDEVTLTGPTQVSEIGNESREFTWTPQDFGIREAPLDSIIVPDPAGSASMIRDVLAGESGPPRDIVLLNAAAALYVAGAVADPRQGAQRAAEAIDRGAASKLLDELVRLTNA